MRVITKGKFGATIDEPVKGSVVVMKLANGTLMAYRHGQEDLARANREYRWWVSDKPSKFHAESWIEILRSGEVLAVFYP